MDPFKGSSKDSSISLDKPKERKKERKKRLLKKTTKD